MGNGKHKKLIKPLIITGSILVFIGAIIAFVPFRNIQSNLITTMAIKYAQKNHKEAGYTNNSIITFCEMDNLLFKGVSLGYEDDSYVVMNVGDNGKLHTNIIDGSGVDTCSKKQKLLMYDYNSPEVIYADIVGSFTGYDVYYMNGNTEVLLTPSNAANYLNVNIGTKITLKFVDKSNSSNYYTALVSMKDANLPVIGVVHDGKFTDIDDMSEIEIDQFDESFYENYQIVGVTKTGQSILLSSSSSVDITKTGTQVITYSYTTPDGTTIRKNITFNVKKKDKISITGANVTYEASGNTYDKAKISVSTNVSSDVRFSLNNKDFKYIGNIEVDQNGEYTIYAKDVSTGDVSEGHKVLVVDIGKRVPGSTTNPPSGDTSYRVTITNPNKDKWTKDAQTMTLKANKEGLEIYTCVTTNTTCTPDTKNTSGSVTVSNNGERVCAKAKDDKKESSVACSKPAMIDANKPIVSVKTVGEVKKNEQNEIISKSITIGLSVDALSGHKTVKYCSGASTCTPNKKASNLNSVVKLTETSYVCAVATNNLDVEGDVTCQEYKFASEAETAEETEFNETITLSYDEAKKELVIVATSVGGELSKTFNITLSGSVSGKKTVTATLNSEKNSATARYKITGDTDGAVTATVSTTSGPAQQTYSNAITFNYSKNEPTTGGSCEIRVDGDLDASGNFYTGDVEVNMFNLDSSKTVSKVELNGNKVTGNLRMTESGTVHGKMYYSDNSVCEADASITINKNDLDFSKTEVSGVSCAVTYAGNTPSYTYSFGFTDNNDYGYYEAKWIIGTEQETHTGSKKSNSHSTFEEDVMVNVTLKDANGGSIKQLKSYMASLEEKNCTGYRSDTTVIKEAYSVKLDFNKSTTVSGKTVISGDYVEITVKGTSEFDSNVVFKGAVNGQVEDLTLGTKKRFTINKNAQTAIIIVDAYYDDDVIVLHQNTYEVDNIVPEVEVTRAGNTLTGKLKDGVVLLGSQKEMGWKLNGTLIRSGSNTIDTKLYGNGTYTFFIVSRVGLEGSQDYVVSDLNVKSYTATPNFPTYDAADNTYYGSASMTIESTKDIKSVTFVGTGTPSGGRVNSKKYTFTGITNPAGSSFHFMIKYEDGTSETTQKWNQTIYTRKMNHTINENYSGGKYVYTASVENAGSLTCTFKLSTGATSSGNSFTLSSTSRATWAKLECGSGSEYRKYMKYFTGNIDDASAACALTGVTDGAKYSSKPNMGVTGGSMYRGQYRTSIVPSSPGTYTFHCVDAFAAHGPDVTFEIVASSNLPSISGVNITPSKDAANNPIALVSADVTNANYISEYCLDGSCSTSRKQFTITDSNTHTFSIKSNVINPATGTKYSPNGYSFSVPEATFATAPESTQPDCHIDTGSGTINLIVDNVEDTSKVTDITLTIGRSGSKIANGSSISDVVASLGLDDNNSHKIFGTYKYEGKTYSCTADFKYAGSCDLSSTSLTLNGSAITVNYKEKEHGQVFDFDGSIVGTNLGTITSNNLITLNSTNYENTGYVKIKKEGCNAIDLNYTYYYYDNAYHNEARPEEAACSIEISNAVKDGNLYNSAYVIVKSDPLAKNVKLYVDDNAYVGLSINALNGTHSYKCGSTGYGSTNYKKTVYSNATTIEVDNNIITLDVVPSVSSDKKHFDVSLKCKIVNGGATVNSSDVTFTMDGKTVNGTVTNLELGSSHTFVATYKNGYNVTKTYSVPDVIADDYKASINFSGIKADNKLIVGYGKTGILTITDSKNKVHAVSEVTTKVKYYMDGSEVDSLTTTKAGNHTFGAIVTLVGGTTINASPASVYVDTEAPQISNATLTGENKLLFSVTDDSGIAYVKVTGKGQIALQSPTNASKKESYAIDIPESQIDESGVITITVSDEADNKATTTVTATVTLDADCTLDTNIHPKDGYYNALPKVIITFENTNGRVFTHELKDYGIKTDSGSYKKATYIDAQYGNHTYTGKAKANSTENLCTLTLDIKEEFIDTVRPTIDSINYDSLSKTLTVNASDDKSGVDHYFISGIGKNTSGVFTNVKPGNYTIYVYDKVGHVISQGFEAKEGSQTEGESSCTYIVRGTKSNGYYVNAEVIINAYDKGTKIIDLSKYTSATNYRPNGLLNRSGEYSYSLSYKDSQGKSVSCKSETIKIDADAPKLTVSSNPSTGTISASAKDEKSGMKTVKIYDSNGKLLSAGVGAISYTATKNGTYIIEAKDNLGNESAEPVTISKLPAGSGCSLSVDASYQPNADGWYGVAPVIRYTKTGMAELKSRDFRLNGISKGSSITNVKLGDGTNTVSAYQTEMDGTTHSECSVTVKVDTKAPTISLSYNESRKAVTYSTSDSLSKIATATLYNGSTVVWTKNNISLTSGEVSNAKAGTYKLVATDKVGNSNEAVVTVTAETEAPQPTPEKGTCTVKANASPNANGWYNTAPTLTINVTKLPTGEYPKRTCVDKTSTSCNQASVVASEGSYSYKGTVQTNLSTFECSSDTIKVDTTKPGIVRSLNGTVISFRGSDSGSGVSSIEVSLGGVAKKTIVNETESTYTATESGTYKILVKDKAGNTNSLNVTVIVPEEEPEQPVDDKQECSFSVEGTGSNGWYRSNVKISLNIPSGATSAKINRISTTSYTQESGSKKYEGNYTLNGLFYSCERTINIDKDVPTVGKAYNKDTGILAISASDTGSGLSSIKIMVNGMNVASKTASGSHSSLTYNPTLAGTYVYYVYDKAGNVNSGSIVVSEIPSNTTTSTKCTLSVSGGTKGNNNWYTAAPSFSVSVDGTDGIKTKTIVNNSSKSTVTAPVEGNNSYTANVTTNNGAQLSCSATVKLDTKDPVANFTIRSNGRLVSSSNKGTSGIASSQWYVGGVLKSSNSYYDVKFTSRTSVTLLITSDSGRTASIDKNVTATPHVSCDEGFTLTSVGKCYKGPVYTYGSWTISVDKNVSGSASSKDTCSNASSTATSCEIITPYAQQVCQYGMGLGSSCYHQVKKTRTKTKTADAQSVDPTTTYTYS